MPDTVFRYTFAESIPMVEVEETLHLALITARILHGEEQVRLHARYTLDRRSRRCVVDEGSAVGLDLNRILLGFLRREYGDDGFALERTSESSGRSGGFVAVS